MLGEAPSALSQAHPSEGFIPKNSNNDSRAALRAVSGYLIRRSSNNNSCVALRAQCWDMSSVRHSGNKTVVTPAKAGSLEVFLLCVSPLLWRVL